VETADSTYGSDKDGPVCGYLFVPGQPATPIDADGAADWLDAPVQSPTNAFVWLNFSLANAASERWIRRHLSLPESSLESLHGDIGSTRPEQDGDASARSARSAVFGLRSRTVRRFAPRPTCSATCCGIRRRCWSTSSASRPPG
jgi:hypothetical protein